MRIEFGRPTLLVCYLAFSILGLSKVGAQTPGSLKPTAETATQHDGHEGHRISPDLSVARIQAELNFTKDTAKALDQLQELLKKDPNNVEAHMTCGKVLQLLGYEDLADDQYKIVDRLDPTKPNSVLDLFHSKLENEGPIAAGEYIRYVEKRFPHDASVLLMQGIIERMHGREEHAEFYYREAMLQHPDMPGLASALASLRLSQGRFVEALDLANRDLKLNKDHPAANLAKGEALLAMGRPDAAIPCIRIALKYPKNDKRAIASLLSRACMSNGQFSDAIEPTLIELASTSVKDKPAVERIKKRLLVILHRAKPVELLNSMLVLLPDIRDREDAATVYFALGDVLDRANFPGEAEIAFIRGLKLRPNSARPYLRVGIIKEEGADYIGAFQCYMLAYQIDQNDREIAARLLRLYMRSTKQKRDLAWLLKDLLHGGRVSEIDTSKVNFQI